MEERQPTPRVGNLVKISEDYPNTQAAGRIGLVIKTMGIDCVVEPIGPNLSVSQFQHGRPWWFSRTDLEVL